MCVFIHAKHCFLDHYGKYVSIVILANLSGQISNKGFMTYYGMHKSQPIFLKSHIGKLLFNSEKLTKNISNIAIASKNSFFFMQMLGIASYVLGYRESIAAISLPLNRPTQIVALSRFTTDFVIF